MVLYKDLHKKSEDLLNKDWPHQSSFEVENNWKSGEWSFKNKSGLLGGFPLQHLATMCPAWGASKTSTGGCCSGKKCCEDKNSCPPGCCSTGTTSCWAPVTTNEITYENSASAITLKFDSNGNWSKESKLKNLMEGLHLTAKAMSNWNVELGLEHNSSFHSQLTVLPTSNHVVLNSSYPVAKDITLGAELASSLQTNSHKIAFSALYANFLPALTGSSFGLKVANDLSSNKTHLTSYLYMSQGKQTESVASINFTVNGAKSLPQLTFATKQHLSNEFSVKASINDALVTKLAAHWKPTQSVISGQIGLGWDQKSGAKAGVKFAFNL
jgi:hypothetical protein